MIKIGQHIGHFPEKPSGQHHGKGFSPFLMSQRAGLVERMLNTLLVQSRAII